MPLLSEAKLLDSFKIVLVGPHGCGKSIMCGDFYKLGDVHYSDFDGRMKPVLNHFKNNPEALGKISYESYPSVRFKRFMNFVDEIQGPNGPRYNGKPFKTWVVDSVTSISNSSVVYQLLSKDKIKTTKGGLPSTSWDEINGETVFITMLLEACSYLNEQFGLNIIWTAHPIAKTEIINPGELNQESRRYESIASYGYKIPSIIPTKFDELYRIKMEKRFEGGKETYKRIAITSLANSEEVIAKTALDLPTKIDVGDGLYTSIMRNLPKQEQRQEQEQEKK